MSNGRDKSPARPVTPPNISEEPYENPSDTPFKPGSSNTFGHNEKVDSIAAQINLEMHGQVDRYFKDQDLFDSNNLDRFNDVLQQCIDLGLYVGEEGNRHWAFHEGKKKFKNPKLTSWARSIPTTEPDWYIPVMSLFNTLADLLSPSSANVFGSQPNRAPRSQGSLEKPGFGCFSPGTDLENFDPPWQDFLAVGDFKKSWSSASEIQLARYARKIRQARPSLRAVYSFYGSPSSVFLLEFHPDRVLWSTRFNPNQDPRMLLGLISKLASPELLDQQNSEGFKINDTFRLKTSPATFSTLTWLTQPNPIFVTSSLFGRLTSAWIGNIFFVDEDKSTQGVVVKDFWCSPQRAYKEGELLETLNDNGVIGVPKLITSGILQYQGKDDLLDDLLRARLIMLGVNGQGLLSPKLSLVTLIEAIRDAARVLWQAWTKSKIRHRDISVNNFVVAHKNREDSSHLQYLRTVGLEAEGPFTAEVIDWGNAVQQGKPSGLDCRSGTLAFLSMNMLEDRISIDTLSQLPSNEQANQHQIVMDNLHKHTIGDDLESLYWVFIWVLGHRAGEPLKKLYPWTLVNEALSSKQLFGRNHLNAFQKALTDDVGDLPQALAEIVFEINRNRRLQARDFFLDEEWNDVFDRFIRSLNTFINTQQSSISSAQENRRGECFSSKRHRP